MSMSFLGRRKRLLALLLTLVLLIPMIAACGSGDTATTAPSTSGNATATTGTTAADPTAAPTEDASAAPTATTAAADAPTAAPAAGESDKFLVFGGSGEPDSLDFGQGLHVLGLRVGRRGDRCGSFH